MVIQSGVIADAMCDPLEVESYRRRHTVLREFSGKHEVKLVERRHFEDLAGDIIKEQYGLALRNDILNDSGRHQRGWRGLGLRPLASHNEAERPVNPQISSGNRG